MAASNGHAHVDDATPPSMRSPHSSVADVDACRCAAWHALGDLSSHTFAHRHLALPPDFVAYLLEDGLSLAADSQAMPARIRPDIAEQMESAFTLSDEEDGGRRRRTRRERLGWDVVRATSRHLGRRRQFGLVGR